MIAVVLSTLFTASILLAVTTIVGSLRRYGRAALALRGELARCAEWRELRASRREVTVCSTATVLRPDFAARRAVRRALPAAA